MSTRSNATIGPDRLEALFGRAVVELGAIVNAALVVIGDRLGLYRALTQAGRLSPVEFAARIGTAERYMPVRLGAQAGEPRLRDTVARDGLARFRRAAPFSLVFEARP